MCEGYWDRRQQRWVSLDELELQETADLLLPEVKLPPPATDLRRKPTAMLR